MPAPCEPPAPLVTPHIIAHLRISCQVPPWSPARRRPPKNFGDRVEPSSGFRLPARALVAPADFAVRPPSAPSAVSVSTRVFQTERGVPAFPAHFHTVDAHMHDATATTPKKGNAGFSCVHVTKVTHAFSYTTRASRIPRAPHPRTPLLSMHAHCAARRAHRRARAHASWKFSRIERQGPRLTRDLKVGILYVAPSKKAATHHRQENPKEHPAHGHITFVAFPEEKAPNLYRPLLQGACRDSQTLRRPPPYERPHRLRHHGVQAQG